MPTVTARLLAVLLAALTLCSIELLGGGGAFVFLLLLLAPGAAEQDALRVRFSLALLPVAAHAAVVEDDDIGHKRGNARSARRERERRAYTCILTALAGDREIRM